VRHCEGDKFNAKAETYQMCKNLLMVKNLTFFKSDKMIRLSMSLGNFISLHSISRPDLLH